MIRPIQTWLKNLATARHPLRGKSSGRWARTVETLECRTVPATITVTTLGDLAVGNNLVSLREAIQAANSDTSVDGSTAGSGADTIVFDPSLFATADGTIQISQFDTGLDSGEIGPTAFTISSEITIIGPAVQATYGTNGVTISRSSSSNFRLFTVTGTGNLTLDTLTIANGSAFGFQGGFGGVGGGGSAGLGGAVFVQKDGTLAIRNSLLTGNVAQGGPGGSQGFSTSGGAGAGLGANGANGQYNGQIRPLGGGPNGRHHGFGGGYGGGQGGGYGEGGSGGTSTARPNYGIPGQTVTSGGSGGFGAGGGGGGIITSRLEGSETEYAWGGNGGFGGGGGGQQTFGIGGRPGYGAGTSQGFKAGGGAGMGGAVFSNGGTVTITNSTLTGNAANGSGNTPQDGRGFGGAVFALNGSLSILNSTISGNTVGGELGSKARGVMVLGYGRYESATATAVISNSIIAQGDTNQSDVVIKSSRLGSVTASGSGNIIGSNEGLGGVTVVSTANPMLAPLADNGGPTKTFGLIAGSPALDVGDNAAISGLSFDQRGTGFNRIVNGTVDIGAFEGVYNNPPVAQNNTVTTVEDVTRAFSLADFTFTDVENNPLASITITSVTLAAGDTLTVNQGAGPVAITSRLSITAAQIPTITYTPANNQFGAARSSLQFTVNDPSPAYGTVAATLTINVTQAPDAPTALALSSTSVNELQPFGFLVGNFQTTDADPADTFTYSLVRGTGDDFNWLFSIEEDLLLTAAVFDASYLQSLPVRIRVTDANGFFLEQAFTITVTTAQSVPTYRAYNPTTDAHFFTTNQAEFQNAIANGFRDETTDDNGFQLLDNPAAGATKIYRLYNILTGQHYYTTNPSERDFLVALLPPPASGPDTRTFGWRDEGINSYIYSSPVAGTLPIFRLYNSNSGTHLYTESTAIRDAILSIAGPVGRPAPWSLQGILGYAFPAGTGSQSGSPQGSSATAAALPVVATASSTDSTEVGDEGADEVSLGLIAASSQIVAAPPLAVASSPEASVPSATITKTGSTVPLAFSLDLVLQTWTDELSSSLQ
jgi:CSLREA domain-containing protein